MKKILLAFGLFIFSAGNIWTQTIVSKPVLPEGYQQWPNVFMRKLALDEKNTLTYTVWVRKFSRGANNYESVFIYEINRVKVIAYYLNLNENSNQKIFPSIHTGTFLFVGDGYVLMDDKTEIDLLERWQSKHEEAIQKKFGLSSTAFERIGRFVNFSGSDLEKFFEHCVIVDERR